MIKLRVQDDNIKLSVMDEPPITLGVEESLSIGNASVRIGSVEDGSPLSITNSGTSAHAVLNFVIPASIEHLGQGEVVTFYCGSATEVT